MNWYHEATREWLQSVRNAPEKYEFEPPASENTIAEIEEALFILPPEELCILWKEANGLRDHDGHAIWSVQKVIEANLELRSYPHQNDLYMTFDSLFCFASEPNSDFYFFPIQGDGKANRPDVFVWEHETDSRKWIAPDLPSFLKKYFCVPPGER